MNKVLHICAFFLLVLVFSCEKKKTPYALSLNPMPYVEYRQPFAGIYTGTYLVTGKQCGTTNNCSPLDTTIYSQSYSYSVSIDQTSDSLLLIENSYGGSQYKINGSGIYEKNESGGSQSQYRRFIFRNDSLLVNSNSRSGYVAFGCSYSYGNFSGKKQ